MPYDIKEYTANADAQAKKDEVYLNLVLEYVPETVYRASRHYAKMKQTMPMSYIKLYMWVAFLLSLLGMNRC